MRCGNMSDLIKNSNYVNDEESFNKMGQETHEKYKNAYVVVGSVGTVLTVGHRYRRLMKN